jgi:siroheme synthase-like protein
MKIKHKDTVTYCPAFLNLRDKKCVVVGGGGVALRKVRMLLECGTAVTVISRKHHPQISQLARDKVIRLIRRDFDPGDLEGARIVVAATDGRRVNRKVAVEAKRVGALVNVVDDPAHSDWIVPSYFRRGDLTIAVSTAGCSPALAKKIRTRLEQTFGEEYHSLLSLAEDVRRALRKDGIAVSPEIWQEHLDLDSLIKLVKKGQPQKVKRLLLSRMKPKQSEHGTSSPLS